MKKYLGAAVAAVNLVLMTTAAMAQDIDGIVEHPMIERYPGQVIAWQHIENYQPYKVAVGPVSGYRAIADWIETEGRVTRTFYKYEGENRSYSEVYKNYLDALKAEGFEILGEGISADRLEKLHPTTDSYFVTTHFRPKSFPYLVHSKRPASGKGTGRTTMVERSPNFTDQSPLGHIGAVILTDGDLLVAWHQRMGNGTHLLVYGLFVNSRLSEFTDRGYGH